MYIKYFVNYQKKILITVWSRRTRACFKRNSAIGDRYIFRNIRDTHRMDASVADESCAASEVQKQLRNALDLQVEHLRKITTSVPR